MRYIVEEHLFHNIIVQEKYCSHIVEHEKLSKKRINLINFYIKLFSKKL